MGLPDGNVKYVSEIGDVVLSPDITLDNVLYIDNFNHNLLFVAKLLKDKNIQLLFNKHGCMLQDLSIKEDILFGRKENDLYKLVKGCNDDKIDDEVPLSTRTDGKVVSCDNVVNLKLIHARFGHLSSSKMQHIAFCKCKNLKDSFCDTCSLAKHHKLPFNLSKSIAATLFDLIHVDLWGPYRTKSLT